MGGMESVRGASSSLISACIVAWSTLVKKKKYIYIYISISHYTVHSAGRKSPSDISSRIKSFSCGHAAESSSLMSWAEGERQRQAQHKEEQQAAAKEREPFVSTGTSSSQPTSHDCYLTWISALWGS